MACKRVMRRSASTAIGLPLVACGSSKDMRRIFGKRETCSSVTPSKKQRRIADTFVRHEMFGLSLQQGACMTASFLGLVSNMMKGARQRLCSDLVTERTLHHLCRQLHQFSPLLRRSDNILCLRLKRTNILTNKGQNLRFLQRV